MKSFFEEYGFVILAAVVVIALIAMASPVGEAVEDNMKSIVNGFGSKVASQITSETE